MTAETIGGRRLEDVVADRKREAGEIGRELGVVSDEIRQLFGKEVELLNAEIGEQVSLAARAGAMGAAAFILGEVVLVFAALTLMFILSTFIELWLAALITTLVLAGITTLLALRVKDTVRQFSPAPRQFLTSIKEDLQWARSLTT